MSRLAAFKKNWYAPEVRCFSLCYEGWLGITLVLRKIQYSEQLADKLDIPRPSPSSLSSVLLSVDARGISPALPVVQYVKVKYLCRKDGKD